jgi:PQQ-dependent dehydrogenase (methanol/ethanol family)
LPAAGDEAGTLRMGTTGNSHLMLRVIGLAALCFVSAVPGIDAARAGPGAASPAGAERAGDWPMAARDYASTRFSPLADISPANVATLKPAFTFSTGVLRGHEAAPIVVGNTMFIVTPYPNVVYALDLSQPGAPLRWRFEPRPEAFAQGVACCDVVNRGVAYADGKVFLNTLDTQTIALDASNGKEIWRHRAGDIRAGETLTMAPLVVNGRVLIGNSGGKHGVRGWLSALDAEKGKEVWRAYSTGPDRDVLIGPDYKPFYAMERGTDLGVATWPADAWKHGGGTAWGWISYDPELNLVYYGTSGPAPANAEQRPGDNKFTSGLFARDATTGQARWFHQLSPHDQFGYDAVNESILVQLVVAGRPRSVLLHPDRNGYVYVIDRATGEVISATPFVPVNTSTGVDGATGALRYAADKLQRTGTVVRDICPASAGGKNWQPSAYSPRTQLLYIPHQNLCQDQETMQTSYIAGTPYAGSIVKMKPGPGGHRGLVTAWDPAAAKARWIIKEDFPVWSGALVTGGDIVFYGTMDGWFKAVDARDGRLLWQFRTGSGIVGQPISYRGPDGKQYIAVLSGIGGWAGAVVAADLDVRDASAAAGFANAVSDLKQRTTKGGMLHVFALP